MKSQDFINIAIAFFIMCVSLLIISFAHYVYYMPYGETIEIRQENVGHNWEYNKKDREFYIPPPHRWRGLKEK
jgi:hypothetical protein